MHSVHYINYHYCTLTHGTIARCTSLRFTILQRTTVQRGTAQRSAAQRSAAQRSAAHHTVPQRCAAQRIAPNRTVPDRTALHCFVLRCLGLCDDEACRHTILQCVTWLGWVAQGLSSSCSTLSLIGFVSLSTGDEPQLDAKPAMAIGRIQILELRLKGLQDSQKTNNSGWSSSDNSSEGTREKENRL